LYRHIATILNAQILSVPLTPKLTYDLPALRAEIRENCPDVTIICSPNNPTGCVIDEDELARLLESARGLVVIDEAYFEFAGQTAVPLLGRYSNLVVLRTFSKAMGMAGLRIGYLLAAPQLVREFTKAVLPGNLNIISQTAAEVAIELYESKLKPRVELIVQERERLYLALRSIDGLSPVHSHANFMVVRSTLKPGRVYDELLQRDILIRDVSKYPMLSDYFRVTVGSPEENQALVSALRDIFSSKHRE
jgi:histidinol-phosphate aminotransferase